MTELPDVPPAPTYSLGFDEMERITRWMLRYHVALLHTANIQGGDPFFKIVKKDIAHLEKTLDYFGGNSEP